MPAKLRWTVELDRWEQFRFDGLLVRPWSQTRWISSTLRSQLRIPAILPVLATKENDAFGAD
jgi:hypothetical protein